MGKVEEGGQYKVKNKGEGGGQTLNGINVKTGLRNRFYWDDSEYHLPPKCQRQENMPQRDSAPRFPSSSRGFFSAVSLGLYGASSAGARG